MKAGESLLLVGLCCLLAATISGANDRQRSQATSSQNAREEAVKKTVSDFFKAWLIDKKPDQAIAFLHPKIYDNKLLLRDDYLGEWGVKDSYDARQIRSLLLKVFSDIASNSEFTDLSRILLTDRFEKMEQPEGISLINSPLADRYILFKGRDLSDIAERKLDWKYLSRRHPSQNYVGCIAIVRFKTEGEYAEAGMWFLLAESKRKWQIILLGIYGV